MNFDLDDDQTMLRHLVERVANDHYSISERTQTHAAAPAKSDEKWNMLANLGLLSVPVPADRGGLGGGPVEIMVVAEALGRGLVNEAYLAHATIPGLILGHAGGPDCAELLGQMASGAQRVGFGWAERGRGFSIDAPGTRADQVAGGSYTLTGTKLFAAGDDATDRWLVTASASDGSGPGIWLIDAAARGMTIKSYRTLDGLPAAEISLESAPATRLPGAVADVERALDQIRLAVCAELVGIMQTVFDTTVEYLKTRSQFGIAIGSFQALQHRAADLYASMELSRSILYRAVATASADAQETAECIAAAKAYISVAAIQLGEECIQMHGGVGVTDELLIGHAHKRMLVLANMLGDDVAEMRRFESLSKAA